MNRIWNPFKILKNIKRGKEIREQHEPQLIAMYQSKGLTELEFRFDSAVIKLWANSFARYLKCVGGPNYVEIELASPILQQSVICQLRYKFGKQPAEVVEDLKWDVSDIKLRIDDVVTAFDGAYVPEHASRMIRKLQDTVDRAVEHHKVGKNLCTAI